VSGRPTGRIADDRFEGAVIGPALTATISLTSDGRQPVISVEPKGGDISDLRMKLERRG
jgi:hypothetical protein